MVVSLLWFTRSFSESTEMAELLRLRTEVLRCVVFVLIDAGILSVRRFIRAEQARLALQARRDAALRCLGAASRFTETINTATLTSVCKCFY